MEKLSQTQSAWSDGSKPGSLSKVSSFQSHCVSPSSERGHLFPQDVVRGVLTRGLYDIFQRGARKLFLGVMAWIRAGAGGQSDCPVSVDFPTTTMP